MKLEEPPHWIKSKAILPSILARPMANQMSPGSHASGAGRPQLCSYYYPSPAHIQRYTGSGHGSFHPAIMTNSNKATVMLPDLLLKPNGRHLIL